MAYQARTKAQLAARLARDIPEGAYVNLGIGMPTLVANHIPAGRKVILQSENGILGMGLAPAEGLEDYDFVNAGKQPITLLPGGAYFHQADSFAMMRGGHLEQTRVLDDFRGVASRAAVGWQAEEALVHRAHVAHEAFAVDDAQGLERIGEEVGQDAAREIDRADELEQGITALAFHGDQYGGFGSGKCHDDDGGAFRSLDREELPLASACIVPSRPDGVGEFGLLRNAVGGCY